MWVIRASKPGLMPSEAWGKPLYTVYRGHWLWLTKFVYWVYKSLGDSRIMMLDREEERD